MAIGQYGGIIAEWSLRASVEFYLYRVRARARVRVSVYRLKNPFDQCRSTAAVPVVYEARDTAAVLLASSKI